MKALHLNVFIDGYGQELSRRYPVFDGLLPHRHSLRSTLGYTNAALPTLLSGKSPQEHGRLTLWTVARKTPSPFADMSWLRLVPTPLASFGRVRRWMDRRILKQLGWEGYFSSGHLPPSLLRLLDYSEKGDLFRPASLPGIRNIFDTLADRGVATWCFDWRQSESQNIAALRRTIERGEVDWAFLGLQSFDGLVHRLGTDHPLLCSALESTRDAIEALITRAEAVGRSVRVNLFSDHGLAQVTRRVDLRPLLRSCELSATKGQVLLDATLARFYIDDPDQRRRVADALSEQAGGRLLSSSELTALGANFPDRRYGDLIFVLDEGGMIHPSHASRKPCAAMHGYHPDSPSMDAVLLSSEARSRPPKTIAELHGLLLEESAVPALRGAPAPREEVLQG